MSEAMEGGTFAEEIKQGNKTEGKRLSLQKEGKRREDTEAGPGVTEGNLISTA